MAVNDILPLDDAQFGAIGSVRHQVLANASIATQGKAFRSGEPVLKVLGSQYVAPLAALLTGTSSIPAIGTNYLAGIAAGGKPTALREVNTIGGDVSTETATADGYVDVMPLVPGVIYIGNADAPATYGYNTTTGVITQATYDALVGHRVLMKMSNGNPPVFTLLAADASTNPFVVENLDIKKYPGKVAFSIRNGADYKS